jgi:thiosulfate reductase cytochrome b subunit
MDELAQQPAQMDTPRHPWWVRTCHWVVALSFLVLLGSGYVILMCHPRLYWGEVGNNLTPALLELPISRNHQHGGWEDNGPFAKDEPAIVSASRYYTIFNWNWWARSLHFLSAWVLVLSGAIYLVVGLFSNHFRRHFWPWANGLTWDEFWQDVREHLWLPTREPTGETQYRPLQKFAYCGVVFVAMPLVVLSGLAMSPAITAAHPSLGALFGGFQSARTIHFLAAVALVLFLIVHVVMVVRSGFWSRMRSMTFGSKS